MLEILREHGVPLYVSSARRDLDTQRRLVSEGRSLTFNSKHLTGRAFDVDVLGFARDDIPVWFWHILGPWAEQNLQLRWGGRFRSLQDFAHFEEIGP